MFSKEEFKKENLLSALKALDCSRNCPCCEYFSPNDIQKCQDPIPYAVDLLEEFIEEHYKLVEKYNTLLTRFNALENPQPYKFEDLKAGMWVWCEKYDRCVQIVKTRIYEYDTGCFYKGQKLVRVYTNHDFGWDDIPFEENSFYPVQMANARCE